MVTVSLCSRQFLYPSFTNWNNLLPYRQLQRFICGKNFPGIEVFMLWCFLEKNLFLIIGLRVCLIPTDTHLFNKETCLWNQWDFRTAHRRKYEDQVGANFHIGTKYLYQNNRTCWDLLTLIDNLKPKASDETKHWPEIYGEMALFYSWSSWVFLVLKQCMIIREC